MLCSVGRFILFSPWAAIFVHCLLDLIVVKRSRFVIDVAPVVLVYCSGWSHYCALVLSESILDYVRADNLKKAFFRRGDVATGKEATLAETVFSESSIEAFARRELNDYGTTPATANPRSNCRRRRPCRPRWWLNSSSPMFFESRCWSNYWGWESRSQALLSVIDLWAWMASIVIFTFPWLLLAIHFSVSDRSQVRDTTI